MTGLWRKVQNYRTKLLDISRDLHQHRSEYREFREKWARIQPRTDREWRDFWFGFVGLEDGLGDIEHNMSDVGLDMDTTALEALEIIRLNGPDYLTDLPIGQVALLLGLDVPEDPVEREEEESSRVN
ncbi:MAG: hypothetical protein L0332_34525 [Chloroflexi bacterium]|nr:hypothetical protein [Chloroflexota bacterium]